MMKTRREQRAYMIEKLYAWDLLGTTAFEETGNAFVDETLQGVLKHRMRIDELITAHLQRWSLKRLSYVDRAILRLATYEMYETETPGEIVINEALNLTRTFTDEGDDKAVAFNNSVLDKIKKTLNK